MLKYRLKALIALIIAIFFGYFVYTSEPSIKFLGEIPAPKFFKNFPFKLGLDLKGGTHLVYKADTSALDSREIKDAMVALRDVIERRVNLFGVAEPIIATQRKSFEGGFEERLIVDLPGVTNVEEAIKMIGQTPLLEFKIERPEGKEKEELIKKFQENQKALKEGKEIPYPFLEDPYFLTSPLTGRFLKKAILEFDSTTYAPIVLLEFNEEGAKIFQSLTKENIGKIIAIYLDGAPISTPIVREEIPNGRAQITGDFSVKEAKTLVGRLNSGALPIPIQLISTETIGPTLGEKAIEDGIFAGLIGFIVLSIFFILWYRLPGLIAVISLFIYAVFMFSLFKLIPVVLTAAGIAGLIVSFGVAVDANVLIFERTKEELNRGRNIIDSLKEGFKRAWPSIRDSNLTNIIAAVILFWFGTSSVQGFALVFGLGVLVSMITAITITKIFLLSIVFKETKITRFLFKCGITN